MSEPSLARRPTARGMRTGVVSGRVFVPSTLCLVVMVYVWAAESYDVLTVSVGVRAWLYLHSARGGCQ